MNNLDLTRWLLKVRMLWRTRRSQAQQHVACGGQIPQREQSVAARDRNGHISKNRESQSARPASECSGIASEELTGPEETASAERGCSTSAP